MTQDTGTESRGAKSYECDCCWAATYEDGPCVECGCLPGETSKEEKP